MVLGCRAWKGIVNLQERRQKIFEQMQEVAVQMERLRGALWLCDELLKAEEVQCNGDATGTSLDEGKAL